MIAVINVSSALGAKLAFHSLILQHPVIHVIFYPDGSTNQPTPAQEGNAALERLFALSARRLEVRKGELLWQGQRMYLGFRSKEGLAHLALSLVPARGSGGLALYRIETHVK